MSVFTNAVKGATNVFKQPATLSPKKRPEVPPSLMTLADLSPKQISSLILRSMAHKYVAKTFGTERNPKTLQGQTVALIFTKRSTRTRVASESASSLLGAHALFLGAQDAQLGVNETLRDTSQVVGSMVNGIMARVGEHEEVETIAKYAGVPVINALSRLYHPTQILADLMVLHETYNPMTPPEEVVSYRPVSSVLAHLRKTSNPLDSFHGKKIAWVGDTNNITNELLVTCPRLGMQMSVAAPKGYDKVEEEVWKRVEEGGSASSVTLTNSPEEALKDADIVVTDTWISMGMEEEKQARLDAFKGYQITNAMVDGAGAKPDWKFIHCLPRKPEEVDDEVFYGPRSLVFPEAENRKWTTAACFESAQYDIHEKTPLMSRTMFGSWRIA